MDKLRNPENFKHQEIMKNYFPDMGGIGRNQLFKSIASASNGSIVEFNNLAFETMKVMEQRKIEHMPMLLDSILLNTLGYECNEQLQNTIYADYTNPHIKKHAKQFIKGQYKIFRNEHENLLGTPGTKTSEIDKI